jgi:hypothetical protein
VFVQSLDHLRLLNLLPLYFGDNRLMQPSFAESSIDSRDVASAGLVLIFFAVMIRGGEKSDLNCLRGAMAHLVKRPHTFLQRLPL